MLKITNITNNQMLIKSTEDFDLAYHCVMIHTLIAIDIIKNQNIPYHIDFIDEQLKCKIEINTDILTNTLILSEIECEEESEPWDMLKMFIQLLAITENEKSNIKKRYLN